MQTTHENFDKPVDTNETHNATENNKTKAHVIRRNIEDYLEQKALERRLTEVIDEDLSLGW